MSILYIYNFCKTIHQNRFTIFSGYVLFFLLFQPTMMSPPGMSPFMPSWPVRPPTFMPVSTCMFIATCFVFYYLTNSLHPVLTQ